MKRLCLILTIMLLLVGCGSTVYHWDFVYTADDVKEIKLVDVSGDLTLSIIKELDVRFANELYSDIMNLEMKRYGTNLSHPSGICFLIVFDSGEYDIIAKIESQHYRYDGDRILAYNSWLCCNEAEFDALVDKYLALAHTTADGSREPS